jgi:hypothetical protein
MLYFRGHPIGNGVGCGGGASLVVVQGWRCKVGSSASAFFLGHLLPFYYSPGDVSGKSNLAFVFKIAHKRSHLVDRRALGFCLCCFKQRCPGHPRQNCILSPRCCSEHCLLLNFSLPLFGRPCAAALSARLAAASVVLTVCGCVDCEWELLVAF